MKKLIEYKTYTVKSPYGDELNVFIDTKGDLFFPCYQSVASVVQIGLLYVIPVREIRKLVEILSPSVLVNTEELPRGIQTSKIIHYTLILPVIKLHNPKLYREMMKTGVLIYLHKLVGYFIFD